MYLCKGGGPCWTLAAVPGRILADLAGRFPGIDFVGVDRSEAMSDLARRILCGSPTTGVELDASDFGFEPVRLPGFGLTNVTVRTASLEEMSVTARRYDLVIASHLLDRVDDPAAALDRLMRLVAAQGRLLIASAFNYEHRRQWDALPSAAAVIERVCDAGWRIEVLDDNVAYREQLDARGTVTQHRVLLLRVRRPGSGPEPGVLGDEPSRQGWDAFDAHRQGVSRETSSLGLLSPEHAQGHASLLVIMSTKVTVDHGKKAAPQSIWDPRRACRPAFGNRRVEVTLAHVYRLRDLSATRPSPATC